jgi:hypothetical protein
MIGRRVGTYLPVAYGVLRDLPSFVFAPKSGRSG